ncbi:MAG: hypothetical protein MI892_16035 [Desulfobacterales bacterium]|nr:hypothetical protein [Desulfobacterales bacterium]
MFKDKRCLAIISIAMLMIISMFTSSAWSGSVKVITGAGTSMDSIDEGTIKKIFLGKTKSLPNGNKVEFVTLKSGPAHDSFLKAYVKKSASQFKTYWKKQVFTGKGKSPKTFGSETELAAYVAGKSDTIGYVSAGADLTGVKVLNEK